MNVTRGFKIAWLLAATTFLAAAVSAPSINAAKADSTQQTEKKKKAKTETTKSGDGTTAPNGPPERGAPAY